MNKTIIKWVLSIVFFVSFSIFINLGGIHQHNQEIAQNLQQQREQQIDHLSATLSSFFGGH